MPEKIKLLSARANNNVLVVVVVPNGWKTGLSHRYSPLFPFNEEEKHVSPDTGRVR